MGYALRIYEAFKDDEVKAKILAEFIDMVEQAINNNQLATRQDLSLTELKLIKEIEQIRGENKDAELKLTREIKETELNLTNQIKELELKLTKEIEQTRGELAKEIEQLRGEFTKEIEQVKKDLTLEIYHSKISTIRWVVTLFIAQTITIIGVIAGLLKLFL